MPPPQDAQPQEPESQGNAPGWQRINTAALRRLEDLAQSRVGKTLAGRFQLERLIALGGMAAVYEAIQKPLNRRVAVKILHPTEIEAGRRDYFLREANAVAGLRHPNIISIVDFGQEEDGTLFLAMEHVPGLTFSELLSQHYPLEFTRLIHIIEQVCLALEVAHKANVVHCDMKPSNIMIESMPGNPDHVKVLDFGIARTLQKDVSEGEDSDEIIGSYYYMAPEQIRGKAVSPRTDVYGLGVVMYTALTAAFPFGEADDGALMQAILTKTPPRPSAVRPGLMIPPALEAVVLKAMAKDPEQRFASCAAMRKALLQIQTEHQSSLELAEEEPHSLDILLPEHELFEIEIDMEVSLEEEEEEIELSLLTPSGQESIEEALEAAREAPSLPRTAPVDAMELHATGSHLARRAPLIGRTDELRSLHRAAMLTRRGSVAVHVLGEYGCGNSFFLARSLEALNAESGATVLLCALAQGDREYALRALSRLVGAALDEYENLLGGASSADMRGSFRARERVFQRLDLGNLETATLHSLLARWNLHQGHQGRPYEGTPLRFPETRQQLLRHAFVELLRALLMLSRELSRNERAQRAPLVVAVDGWEHCDGPTRQLLREVLTHQRNLPLLFIAASHIQHPMDRDPFPEDIGAPSAAPFTDGRPWDMELGLRPFNQEEVHDYLSWRLGKPPAPAVAQRIHTISQGNALYIKDLLQQMRTHGDPEEEQGQERWALEELPETAARMFATQIDRLSRDAKMLLAVCTLLGHAFPEEAVRAVMPEGFDVDGTFTELFGARILETTEDMQRLHFRYPLMHLVSLRRLHPKLRRGLHARIAALLAEKHTFHLPTQEAELWRAVHTLKSGEVLPALDVLLDSAQNAMERWEPHLALRRCRQLQIWLAAFLAQQQSLRGDQGVAVLGAPLLHESATPEIPSELLSTVTAAELELRAMRANMILLYAARRLDIAPSTQPDAIVPERLPQGMLHQLEHHEHLPRRLRAMAALEAGRYLSRIELPQAARRAFQIAAYQARQVQSVHLILHIEMEMARNLHRLGRLSPAVEMTQHVIQHLRKPLPAPQSDDLPPLKLSRPLDRLAKIYIERRLYARAEHHLDQALSSAESDGDEDRLGKIYLHYAALARVQGHHARTLQALHRALDVAKRTHDLRAMARVLYNQGVTAANLGRRAEARVYLSDAAEVAINLGWTDFITLVNGQLKRL